VNAPGARVTPQRVTVELADRNYDVTIGPHTLQGLGPLVSIAGARGSGRVCLVIDDGLPAERIDEARTSLEAAGATITEHALDPSEQRKSLHTLATLLRAIAASRHERGDVLIALGGGIVGDVAGFAAATYRRGVPVIQCPTTLLAMVDASVGGKTGVNLDLSTPRGGPPDLLKNMVGAFHQPAAVLADVATLSSLPDRTFRAGLAECVKHALLAGEWNDPDLLAWTETSAPAILARDPAVLTELIARNVRIKAAVVAADEREAALGPRSRATLNLGHTFAHALETIPELSPDDDPANAPLQHGEAVALGLLAACRAAAHLGRADPSIEDQTRQLLTSVGLPTAVANLPPTDVIVARMQHDKKVAGGELRLVIPVHGSRAELVSDVPQSAIQAGLDAIVR